MRHRTTFFLSYLFLLIFMAPSVGEASHLVGASIEYECLNNCSIRVEFKGYRDCSGASAVPDSLLFTPTNGNCSVPAVLGPWSTQWITEVTPVCQGWPSSCTQIGAPVNGVQEYQSFRDYNICGAASGCTFEISWATCCRNPSITNILTPGSGSIWINSSLNTSLTTCNSAPQWNEHPIAYICNSQPHFSDQGATDSDGDSLAYRLSTCYNTSDTVPVVYQNGYSALNPLGPNWTTYLDPVTGQFTILPSPGATEVAIVCIYIDEYRNGQLIGSYGRDIQITVLNCTPGNAAPSFSGITNLSGTNVSQSGNTLNICAGNNLSFEMEATDANQDTVTLLWSQNAPGATFAQSNAPSIQDTLRGIDPKGIFSWTPAVNGTYQISFYAEDDNCPFSATEVTTVTIVVGAVCSHASANPLGCNDVEFTAQGLGGTGNYTYTWSGQGGLSSSADSLVYSYPGAGVYSWQVIITDGASVNDTISGSVSIGGPVYLPLLSHSGDIDPCGSGNSILGVNAFYPSFLWSTGDTTATITVNTPGTYGVTVSANNGCQYYDSLQVGLDLPDVSGILSNSGLQPMSNQQVLLIKYDFNNASLLALDTTYTDPNGYYQFCSITDTVVYVKAIPDSVNWPGEMPTYADTALVWNHARPLSLFSNPHQVNFSTLAGQNPGGPGFIGGLITQGANKTGGIGDPIAGLTVFIKDDANGNILGYAVTDSNGYFSLGNLPYANLRVIADAPGVDDLQVPVVPLTAGNFLRDSLDFRLHSNYLEWVGDPNELPQTEAPFSFHAVPNPFQESTCIHINLTENSWVHVEVFNLNGQQVTVLANQSLASGNHRFHFSTGDKEKASGLYFVKLRIGNRVEHLKIMEAH